MITVKIRLFPTKMQEERFWWLSKVSRNYWNLLVTLDREVSKGTYDNLFVNNKTYFSKFYDREVKILSQSDYLHLASYICKDAWYLRKNQSFIYTSIMKEFLTIKRLNKNKVRYRSIDKIKPSFPIRCDKSSDGKRSSRIYVKKDNNKIVIPSVGDVRYSKSHLPIKLDCKKQTARVVYDGKYWFLEFSCNEVVQRKVSNVSSEAVGIDLGIKDFATISNGKVYKSLARSRRFRILTKRLKKFQRKLSKKYEITKSTKKTKTNNIKKLEKKIKLIHRSIANLRQELLRKVVSEVTKVRPQHIAIEDLNVRGMLKNKHLAYYIQNHSFYTFRHLIEIRCKELKIPLHIVNRWYGSSKTCHACGYYKKELRLSEREWLCPVCGKLLLRDINASKNLRDTDKYVLA